MFSVGLLEFALSVIYSLCQLLDLSVPINDILPPELTFLTFLPV